MTRAEQRALETYPYSPTEVNLFGHKTITADGNSCDRAKYLKGYEQAEKDLAIMWKEKIRAEIEQQYETLKVEYSKTKGAYVAGRMDALDYMEQFINFLPDEPVDADAAMKELDEKIKLTKEHGSWKGVDVDKFMDEVRGRESDDLKEAAREWAEAHYKDLVSQQVCADDFIAGAEWMAKQGYSYEDKVYLLDGGDTCESYPGLDGEGEKQCIDKAVKDGYLKVGDKVIVQIRKKKEDEK